MCFVLFWFQNVSSEKKAKVKKVKKEKTEKTVSPVKAAVTTAKEPTDGVPEEHAAGRFSNFPIREKTISKLHGMRCYSIVLAITLCLI